MGACTLSFSLLFGGTFSHLLVFMDYLRPSRRAIFTHKVEKV